MYFSLYQKSFSFSLFFFMLSYAFPWYVWKNYIIYSRSRVWQRYNTELNRIMYVYDG